MLLMHTVHCDEPKVSPRRGNAGLHPRVHIWIHEGGWEPQENSDSDSEPGFITNRLIS